MDKDQVRSIYDACSRRLDGHPRLTPARILGDLSGLPNAALKADRYGEGQLIENFEKKVAALLGKPAGVFMPTGKMAQNIALRIWSDRNGTNQVAFHATSHLELHEEHAYSKLHSLQAHLLGEHRRLMTLRELKALPRKIAALLVELPQREIGGVLPTWEELTELCTWSRDQGIALHMDGARLWECGPYFGRPYSEIAALFDSVYVSFYKGLGGIAGAMLLGEKDFVDQARVWQTRHGGTVITLFPYLLSAEHGLDTRLGKMGSYVDRARKVASMLGRFERVSIVPNPPHTNMMHLQFDVPKERFDDVDLGIAREFKTKLFGPSQAIPGEQACGIELTIGDNALEMSEDQIRELFEEFFKRLDD